MFARSQAACDGFDEQPARKSEATSSVPLFDIWGSYRHRLMMLLRVPPPKKIGRVGLDSRDWRHAG